MASRREGGRQEHGVGAETMGTQQSGKRVGGHSHEQPRAFRAAPRQRKPAQVAAPNRRLREVNARGADPQREPGVARNDQGDAAAAAERRQGAGQTLAEVAIAGTDDDGSATARAASRHRPARKMFDRRQRIPEPFLVGEENEIGNAPPPPGFACLELPGGRC